MTENVEIVDWVGDSVPKIKQAGYVPRQSFQTDMSEVLEIVGALFGTGLNVMLSRHSNGSVQIFVDTKRFSQR